MLCAKSDKNLLWDELKILKKKVVCQEPYKNWLLPIEIKHSLTKWPVVEEGRVGNVGGLVRLKGW